MVACENGRALWNERAPHVRKKGRIEKFGDGSVPGAIPKGQQLFKCWICGEFHRLPDKAPDGRCPVCVASEHARNKEPREKDPVRSEDQSGPDGA